MYGCACLGKLKKFASPKGIVCLSHQGEKLNLVDASPSAAASILMAATRMTLRTTLSVATATPLVSSWPWPYGVIDALASLWPKSPHTRRENIRLTNVTAALIHANGVPLYTGRVVLYLHGGAFLTCGVHTHHALMTSLSKRAQAPVLAVDYRMLPHSLEDGLFDCIDAYCWLRQHGYRPDQIVLAGDSAGGYMAMALAIHLAGIETPAAMVLLSPLLQLDPKGKKNHPNMRHDAMFSGCAFDALVALLRKSNGVLYEPLDELHTVAEPSEDLPPTLIHVSGSEVLLHDAMLAEEQLNDLGVPVEVVVWPGQIHVFQIATAFVPEAKQSLDQLGQFIIEKTSKKSAVKPAEHRTATVG